MDRYVGAYFAGLWNHDNLEDNICDNSRTEFMLTFETFFIFWLSKT